MAQQWVCGKLASSVNPEADARKMVENARKYLRSLSPREMQFCYGLKRWIEEDLWMVAVEDDEDDYSPALMV